MWWFVISAIGNWYSAGLSGVLRGDEHPCPKHLMPKVLPGYCQKWKDIPGFPNVPELLVGSPGWEPLHWWTVTYNRILKLNN